MNIKIVNLTRENMNLINDLNSLKIIIQKLSKDKNILIDEISELNKSLNNKIKPKLLKNEDYLLSLENQINILKKENDSLIENDIKQKEMIKNFKNKNKISKINNRKHNNNLFNITKSKSKSTENLFLNMNNSSMNTTKRSKVSKSKSKKNKNSISKNKSSQKNNNKLEKRINYSNNIKNNKKLKKSLSQKNLKKGENILKNKIDKKNSGKNKEGKNLNKDNNISEILNRISDAIKKKNNKDLFVNKENILKSTNKNKEITLSLLSSFNEDKIC